MEDKKQNHINEHDEDIDAFAQALLDKKRDLVITGHEERENRRQNAKDREQAQKALQNALDKLRTDRGQAPIEVEEESFQPTIEDAGSFDSKHLGLTDLADYENQSQAEELADFTHALQFEDQDDDVDDAQDKQPKRTAKKEKPKENNGKDDAKPEKKKSKGHFKWILLVIFLFLTALAGYSYKTLVYDPANTITPAQEKIYKSLVSYADEWDMMSDSEKNELLSRKSDYNKLLDKQKTSLNAYFKEQTGKTFKAWIKDLQAKQDQAEQTAYDSIASLLNQYGSLSQEQKFGLIDMQDEYASLSNSRKKEIDALSQQQASLSFLKLVADLQNQKSEADAQAKKTQIENQIANLEGQLENYQTQLENLKKYQSDLQDELSDPESYGTTTQAIQEAMKTNEQAISTINTTMDNIQKQIDQLKS